VASRDGKPLPNGTATDVTDVIGVGRMIDGWDEAVTGLKAGDQAEFASMISEFDTVEEMKADLTKGVEVSRTADGEAVDCGLRRG
jgi:FKBP-type peptidyl-prolyl cis-trans isomerase (trigger factor)